MLGRRRACVIAIGVLFWCAGTPLMAGSTDFTQAPATPTTAPTYELAAPRFDNQLDRGAIPVTAHPHPSTRPLDERPLVPLPTPAASGIAGLAGLALYALYKNRRRILT